jgi:hypothetical protein
MSYPALPISPRRLSLRAPVLRALSPRASATFALATNHPVRRPTPVILAPLAPAVEVPPIPPDHPHSAPPQRSRSHSRTSSKMEAPRVVSLSCEHPNSSGGVRVAPRKPGREAAHQGAGGSNSGPLGPTRRGAAGSPRTSPLRFPRHSSNPGRGRSHIVPASAAASRTIHATCPI